MQALDFEFLCYNEHLKKFGQKALLQEQHPSVDWDSVALLWEGEKHPLEQLHAVVETV